LDSLSQAAPDLHLDESELEAIIDRTISEEIDVSQQLSVSDDHSERLSERHRQVHSQKAATDSMFEFLQKIVAKKDEIHDDVQRLKPILFAKIVSDKLRYEKAVRETDARFQILQESEPPWGLTTGDAEAAEVFLTDFEARLDQICPIRTLQSPPEAAPDPFASVYGAEAKGRLQKSGLAGTSPVTRRHPE
jgi:hypothetical protein